MPLSVMWMCSGHTSVQHLVMLQRPILKVVLHELAAVERVERVHVEPGEVDEEARPGEARLSGGRG